MEEKMQNFRSAFHGFNRDDVVHYLEELIAQHTNEVNQLQDDLKRRTDELATMRVVSDRAASTASDAIAAKEALEAQVAELTAQLEEATSPEAAAEKEALETKVAELTAQLEAAPTAAAVAEVEALKAENEALCAKIAELEAAAKEAPEEAQTDWAAEELAAYRRAENVERQSRTRASQLCDRTNALIDDLTTRLGSNRAGVEAAAEAIGSALDGLQAALDSACTSMEESASTFGALKLELPQE